jgi:hypothetical protein
MTEMEQVLIARLPKALEAARTVVEFLEALKASTSSGLAEDTAGSPTPSAPSAESLKGTEDVVLATTEDRELVNRWIQELRTKHPPPLQLFPETLRDQYVAEGNAAGFASLIERAKKYFEQVGAEATPQQEAEKLRRRAEARKQQEAEERRQRIEYEQSHPLAFARWRLDKLEREKKTLTDAGGPIREARKGRRSQ